MLSTGLYWNNVYCIEEGKEANYLDVFVYNSIRSLSIMILEWHVCLTTVVDQSGSVVEMYVVYA